MADLVAATASSAGGRRAGPAQGLVVAMAGFFPVMAIVSLAPAVPTILAHFATVPAATTLVPLIVTAPGLMIALLSPLFGWATDRFGRRPLILIATLVYGLFGALPFLLSALPAIFATRFVLGIAEAAILTVTSVLVADYFDPAGRRVWLTVQSVIGPILGVATITSSGILTSIRWNGAFLIYLVAFLMFAIMVPVVFEPRRHAAAHDADRTGAPTPFPWRTVGLYAPVSTFAAVLYYVYIVQAGLAYAEVGLTDASRLGGLLAAVSLGVPVGGILFGVLSKRWGISAVIGLMLALMGAGSLLIGVAGGVPAMIAGSLVQQIGSGMCVASLLFWVSILLPASHRGRGFGLWTSAFFIGQFVSPALAGPFHAATGSMREVFSIAGVIGIAGGLVCWRILVRAGAPEGIAADDAAH